MTKRSSVLARNFFRRDKVRALVPDLRLILAVATVSCETHCGVWLPGDLARDTGLDEAALAGGLADLEARGLVVRDTATGELFLVDFFRDNVFATAPRRGQFRGDFARIESPLLREAVRVAVKNNPACGLLVEDVEPTRKAEIDEDQQLGSQGKKSKEKQSQDFSTAEAPDGCGQNYRRVLAGITVWNPSDEAEVRRLEAVWASDDIATAVSELVARGIDPLPSYVLKELQLTADARAAQNRLEAGVS